MTIFYNLLPGSASSAIMTTQKVIGEEAACHTFLSIPFAIFHPLSMFSYTSWQLSPHVQCHSIRQVYIILHIN